MISAKNTKKFLFLALFALAAGFFYHLEMGRYITLEMIQSHRDQWTELYHQNPVLVIASFFGIYVTLVALSFPGAAILTLLGGALFGLSVGLILISFASSLGATLAFLGAKYLFHDWVQERYGHKLAKLNQGVEQEGAYYLFTLRLVPIFPFFLINLGMALTKIRTWQFYWVSQIGMLPGTLVYVYAGQELGKLTSLKDIVSGPILLAFALIGVMPLFSRKIANYVKAKKAQPI